MRILLCIWRCNITSLYTEFRIPNTNHLAMDETCVIFHGVSYFYIFDIFWAYHNICMTGIHEVSFHIDFLSSFHIFCCWQNFILNRIKFLSSSSKKKCFSAKMMHGIYKIQLPDRSYDLILKANYEKMRAASPIIIFWSPLFENKCMAL